MEGHTSKFHAAEWCVVRNYGRSPKGEAAVRSLTCLKAGRGSRGGRVGGGKALHKVRAQADFGPVSGGEGLDRKDVLIGGGMKARFPKLSGRAIDLDTRAIAVGI